MTTRTFMALAYVCLTAMSGCAITNYGLIVDNDQKRTDGNGSLIVNTNGKAHYGKVGVLTMWPDGTDELLQFIDQKPNGDRTLTTYNNFSTGDEPALSSNLYCNPDWNGCAIFTAPDPQVGDVDEFDGQLNANCSGARSLLILLSTGRYYGECGRKAAKLSLDDKFTLVSRGTVATMRNIEGLLWRWDATNTTIRLQNEEGLSVLLPLWGRGSLWTTIGGRYPLVLDATHAMLGHTMTRYAEWLDTQATHRTTAEICHHGVCVDFSIAGNVAPVSTGSRVRAAALQHY
jgi:hypothetical protein